MRLVLASNNAKKLAELSGLFAALPIELAAQSTLGIAEAEEPHATFVENALAKARHAARTAGAAAIADDSGLCVDALGGAPGVGSAGFAAIALPPGDREAQRRAQDAANNRLLLERLHGSNELRSARYVATLVALRSADDPEPLIALGRWHGSILTAPRGSAGFGYDPLMFIPEFGCSVAEMPAELKALRSHRASAARRMAQLMREAWGLG
ncbi:MAG: non-canonical purine NTP pyrophosphatase [Burkholderiaceae bacterium]